MRPVKCSQVSDPPDIGSELVHSAGHSKDISACVWPAHVDFPFCGNCLGSSETACFYEETPSQVLVMEFFLEFH